MSLAGLNSKKASWSRQHWLAVGIMLLGFLLVVTSVPQNSVTMDEPVHALTGYSILKTGDLRLVEDHPPLLELLMGFPLSLDKQLPQPESLSGWDLRERRTFGNDAAWMHPPIDRWLYPARIPVTFFLVLLTAVVFRWTTDIAGMPAGLLCATLIAFDPNIIAHSGLATLDVGVTALCFSALFLLYRMLNNTSGWRRLCAGIVLGLALASKVSALPLLPIAGIWILIHIYRGGWSKRVGLIWSVLYFSSAILTVWATHLFQVGKSSLFPWVIPAPTFWDSIWRISQHMVNENRFSFLLGSTYRGGVWTFFPATFLLKTPENVLILLFFAVLSIRRLWRLQKYNLIFLLIYPLIYLAVSLTGALNLGYRHLLPVLPFIYLLLGISISSIGKSKWLHYFYFSAVIWQIGIAVISWPDYIPYFNLFAGGTSKGYQYLADSNVDWGQGLKAVNKYLVDNELEQPYISAFTPFVDPTHSYGIQATLLPPQRGESVPLVLPHRYNPEPGDYIISASTLRGLQVADSDMYNWFWHREPQAIIAGSMLHYHVREIIPHRSWVAQCSLPVVPLTHEIVAERFGINNIRIVSFDCSQSWIYPGGDPESGWYVLHNYMLQNDEFINKMLENSNPQYIQETPRDTPRHSVYTFHEPIYSPSVLHNLSAAPGEWDIQKAVSEGSRISLPVNFGDLFTLTSVEVQVNDAFVVLRTQWVVNIRVEVPVSFMAHVINRENQVVAVGDGFGLPYTLLQPNDIFVQKHILEITIEDPSQIYVQTGVYRLDTLERYTVQVDAMVLGDRIIIPVPDNGKY